MQISNSTAVHPERVASPPPGQATTVPSWRLMHESRCVAAAPHAHVPAGEKRATATTNSNAPACAGGSRHKLVPTLIGVRPVEIDTPPADRATCRCPRLIVSRAINGVSGHAGITNGRSTGAAPALGSAVDQQMWLTNFVASLQPESAIH
jgi:hypothetical protein